MTSSLCPFRWASYPQPSIFATDPAFCKASRTGKTMGQIQSAAVARYEARTGKSAGSVHGLSPYADLLIEESTNSRRAAYKRRKG